MAFSIAGGGARGPQINVTPLIDVLLTLIIMFMLVVSMDKQYQEKVRLPQPPKDAKSELPLERTVIIQVVWTAKNQPPTVRINRDDVRWEDLPDPGGESSFRPRRCGRGFSVCRGRDRSCAQRGCAANRAADAGSDGAGGVNLVVLRVVTVVIF
jgi:hypothetical protein